MNKSSGKQTALIVILTLLVVGLLARYVFFKDAIDQRGKDLENLGQREAQYKKDHPNATKADIDAAFKEGMNSMDQRKEDYKTQNPGATDADADAALQEAFNKMDAQ